MSNGLEMNKFFDINKLPPKKGLLLFGLSMNKLLNRQSAEKCLGDIRNFTPSKVSKPLIGCNFIYTDFLYLYNDKPASELKHSFMNLVIDHRNGMKKLIEKNYLEIQIQHAFNYLVWNQLYVGTNDFNNLFERIKRLYKSDEKWQAYMKDDCQTFGREMDDNQINYFLEESLMIYLLNKNQVKLTNEYIENNQEWVLFCYPGRPIKSIVYIHQLNPLKLDWEENPYQNSFYDLEAKRLIDCKRVDLDTYQVV
jgi:hypothetical protein